ncbi:MAG TPA: hypothetical protein QF469_08070 [Sphingomonas sanguinis]|uniref:hypothetical protein n=1 Tax=Sphingomonas sanguinis TaxID=33051 RepID=UPI002AC277BD|nr:hypothetical protein [Sphingomonas sanguinis]
MTAPTLSRGGQALARWLVNGDGKRASSTAMTRSRLRGFVRRTRMSTFMLERLLEGAVVPASDEAIVIARVTKGAVKPEDWEVQGA